MPPRTGGEDGHERWTAALAQRVEEREERIRRAYGAAAEAVTVPAAERRSWVASRPDCLCPEFVELMIAMAREHRGEEPRESVRFAHLAVTAAEEYVRAGGENGDDARALAWAELGNAHRICGDLRLAGIAFYCVRERMHFTSDPLVRAEAYSLEASYLDCVREFDRADSLLQRAERIEARYGTTTGLGRILMQRGITAQRSGSLLKAVDYYERALVNLDCRQEPNLAVVGIHNLADCLIDAGCYTLALGILQRYQLVYEVFATPVVCARRRWLEAKALLRSGSKSMGEALLSAVRLKFAELARPYETALVTLDLAEAHAVAQRWDELEQASGECLAICHAIGASSEAVAAAKVLHDVASRRQESAAAIAFLAAAVRQRLTP